MRLRPAATAGLLLLACGDGLNPPSNIEPSAAFTAACQPSACSFSNLSTDADGTLERYDWDFGDGSARASTRDASHAYAAPGAYPVTLTVTDDDGATAAATTEVTVPEVTSPTNRPPTAGFSVSCSDLTCRFINRSFDPDQDGRVMAIGWDFGDGSAGTTSLDATHTYAQAGEYTVTLTVRDDQGAAATATGTARARLPNVLPTAAFIWLCADLTCEFRDRSEDPDGTLTTYVWRFGSGDTSTERNPIHSFRSAGLHEVTLEVVDDRGGSARRDFVLDVPAPEFTATCESGRCTFALTRAPSGSVHWVFGDGAEGEGQETTHVYDVAHPSTFTVAVHVTDWDFGFGTISNWRDVTITP